MMRSTKCFVVVAVLMPLFCVAAYSQTLSGTLKGQVIDAASKKPLGGVVVLIREQRTNTVTDLEGRFLVGGIRPGSYTVEFVLPDYAGLTKTDVRIQAGGSTVLSIELAALVPQPRIQVEVRGERLSAEERKASSVKTLHYEETVRMPGTVMDVSRALNALPGTSHVSEISNDLIVRGGSPWENGFYIDNVEMPNVNHLQSQGSSGGMIGIVNALFIEDVNFFTGGYSARYGNRMSSIIDIKFREGSRERTNYQLNLNLAGFGASAEGPLLGKKASWLFSFSRNYHDLIAKMIGYGVAPRFGDVHFKLTYDPTPRNKITLLNIYGQSLLSYGLETAVEEGFMGALDYSSRQNTVGLNWLSEWAGSAGSSNTTLSYSFYRISYRLTDLIPSSAWMDYMLNEEGTDSLVLRNINTFNFGRRNKAEFGADIRVETADFKNYFTEYINNWGMDIPAADEHSRTRTSMAGAFLTLILRPWEPVMLSVGVRADYFSYNRRTHLSPRLAASFALGPKVTLNASLGMFRQVLPMFLLASHAANKLNRDPLAVHAIVGLNFDPSESLHLGFELYDKEYRYFPLAPDNPDLFIMDSGIDFEFFRTYAALADTGTAQSRGVEIFLQKRIIEKLYGIFSFSLFRSSFRDYFGIQRDRVNDNRYVLTVVGGYKPDDKWNVSVRWNLAGGVPYTPFAVEASRQANMGMIDNSQIFARRYPDYMTFNFRLDRRWVFSRSTLDLFLSLVNAFNRKNVDRYYWNRIENKPDVIYQAPFIPVFGAEFRF